MTLIYIEGMVTVPAFEQKCAESGLLPQHVVFLFPGNSGHHGPNCTLFSIKGGGGLAKAAYDIGNAGYPTLSLPTTTMENWPTDTNQQNIVLGALEDLYRAIGAGYHLMLPVRAHTKQFFKADLADNPGTEPSFWGQNNLIPNPELAKHYIEQLDKLAKFISLPEKERKEKIEVSSDNPLFQAYLLGQAMKDDDRWFQA